MFAPHPIFIIIAASIILWLIWQLVRAKRFNAFKQLINSELQPKVASTLATKLIAERSELFPNNQAHIDASIFYWSQYPIRVVQAALALELIDMEWLKKTGNERHCQHLFHLQSALRANAELTPIASVNEGAVNKNID